MTSFSSSSIPLNAQASRNKAKFDTNAAEFAREVNDVSKRIAKDVVPLFVAKVALELLRRIVLRSPVDKGTFRLNWQTTVRVPAEGFIAKEGGSAAEVIARGMSVLRNLPPFPVVWLTNNTRYGPILEFGGFVPADPGPSRDPRPGRFGRILVKDGFSVQAPQGMVGIAIEEVRQMFAGVNVGDPTRPGDPTGGAPGGASGLLGRGGPVRGLLEDKS